MGRILAIDYGSKRIGLAVSDPLQIIASALCTLAPHEVIVFLRKYIPEEGVTEAVIGMPKDLQNEDTDATELVENFIKGFQKNFPEVPITAVDERFTSKLASQSILASGANKKDRRNKALVDQVSATIILQDYMMSKGL
jgi:putative holliday junction resolvase